ncbi:hypothetical protein EYF80_065088 [Liparis tanakae]|uniref:Uncharacterized protein n=1 Tax=Liparis tanakae TaxID=230148 RepID=A0A4Z2E775_9TELE|nr:hypothetical protein EYF80_065088 [Liparis tanakae]
MVFSCRVSVSSQVQRRRGPDPSPDSLRQVLVQRLHHQRERGPELQLGARVRVAADPQEVSVSSEPKGVCGEQRLRQGAGGLHVRRAQLRRLTRKKRR